MIERGAELSESYRAALREHLFQAEKRDDGDEDTLRRAYELGREAIGCGLGLVQLAAVHHAELASLLDAPMPAEQAARIIAGGETFFLESLAPFEMSLRGYQEANQSLREVNQELRLRTAEADAANHELETFSYSVAHDLRGPLRRIDGFSAMLLEEQLARLDETGVEQLQRIQANAQHMAEIIEGLLALARITRIGLELSEVDLTSLARATVGRLSQSAPSSQRSVELIVDEGMTVSGDRRLLQQVVENLLDNAWKFSSKQPDPRVHFGVTDEYGERRYFVRDNGAGFDMSFVDKLFKPFQRLHTTQEFPGTGVGLGTVQRIITRHGGRIWAESAVGQGATFYFTLPDRK